MKPLFFICIGILAIFSSCQRELIFEKITHETLYRKKKTTDEYPLLNESWIVHNYRDTKANERAIDEFACHYTDTISLIHGYSSLTFYKHSRRTNMKVLARRHDNISESMTHDYLWHYDFFQGKFLGKTKVKNIEGREFFFERPECVDIIDEDEELEK
ncbi:MAG: hypothetical protein AAFN93_21850 [Bacteroidota bacterium]